MYSLCFCLKFQMSVLLSDYSTLMHLAIYFVHCTMPLFLSLADGIIISMPGGEWFIYSYY